MRIAYLSPLPPQRTGIADYSAALLPELLSRDGVEVHVFTSDEGLDFARTQLEELAGAGTYRQLREQQANEPFDLVIYQMGNSPYHLEIRELALEIPGLVALHEFVLHHLVQAATLARGDDEAYIEEMRYCYGPSGERAARLATDPDISIDLFSYPLFERTVDRSLGVLVHNETTRDRVLASRPTTLVCHVPSALDVAKVQANRDGSAARRRLGIAEETFVCGTFGLVTPAKRLEPTLGAFRELLTERPDSRLVIAGEVSPHYDLDSLLGEGLEEKVILTGRLDEAEFLDTMAAVDVGINLRYPSAGETSYTLLWLLALAKPVLVSARGPAGELPDDVVIPIPIGADEELWLREALCVLAEEPLTRRDLGKRGKAWVEGNNTPSVAVDGYLEAARAAVSETVYRAVPPLTPFSEKDIETEVLAQVAAALGDLGVEETDERPLREIADRMAELGWSQSHPE